MAKFVGSHALIDRLSRYKANATASVFLRVKCQNPRARGLYWRLLDLLDDQPEVDYSTLTYDGFWTWRQEHLVVVTGRAGAIQTAFHLLEARYGRQS